MGKKVLGIIVLCCLAGVVLEAQPVSAAFSVSPTRQVAFAPGNLQYCATTDSWRFAAHQYDIVGKDNGNISPMNKGWIDLFGWGTSGYNYKFPFMVSTAEEDYGDGVKDIAGTSYDWGVNKIAGAAGAWRTLTHDEWVYLFFGRPHADKLFALAKVNGVNGLVILPDAWEKPAGVSLNVATTKGFIPETDCYTSDFDNGFQCNEYTAVEWAALEQQGAVFLPAAGYRYGKDVYYAGTRGSYWSATCRDSYYVYILGFSSGMVHPSIYYTRYYGRAVRLARNL